MKKILVVGDIMLDHYIYGTADRLSPEAPVPVVKFEREEFKLGGAGNVVANLASLEVGIEYYGVVGKDIHGVLINKLLKDLNVGGKLQLLEKVQTTTKQRIIANGQYQLLRIDDESNWDDIIIRNNYGGIHPDLIIISDYGKGAIIKETMKMLIETNIPIIVDPFPAHAEWYNGVFMLTPNLFEWDIIKQQINPDSTTKVLVTKNKDGMDLLFNDMQKADMTIPATSPSIVNVSGAGDTVVAVLAYCIVNGYNIIKAVKLANMCAGYVCQQQGTATVPKEVFNKFEKEVDLNEKIDEEDNILDSDNYCDPIYGPGYRKC